MCDAPAWSAGTNYVVGARVLYNGRVYVATHENPGYDPVISTWFWSPVEGCGTTIRAVALPAAVRRAAERRARPASRAS